jgi:hypothetical protein
LPNCLTREKKVDFNLSRNGVTWLYLFCASCGADGGRVMETDIPNAEEFAFYLCDGCAEKYGALAGMTMVPDDVFFQKVQEAQMEREGRLLQPFEIVKALQDDSHYLSKLAKDRNTFLASVL